MKCLQCGSELTTGDGIDRICQVCKCKNEALNTYHTAKMQEVTDDSVYKRFFDKCNDLHPDLTFDILKLLDSDC